MGWTQGEEGLHSPPLHEMAPPARPATAASKGKSPAGPKGPSSAPNLHRLLANKVSQPVASPRLVQAINPHAWAPATRYRSVRSTDLPVYAPRMLQVRTVCNGTHVLSDLADTTTVGDVAAEVVKRLVLPPHRAVVLVHWGKVLDPGLALREAGLVTGAIVDARLRFREIPSHHVAPTRVRLLCKHLRPRFVNIPAGATVLDVKVDAANFLKSGEHTFYSRDGSVVTVTGPTALARYTRPLDEKNLTSSTRRGEELVVTGLGGQKKDKYLTLRKDSGYRAQVGLEDVVKLDLPPQKMALKLRGRVLDDGTPMSACGLHTDEALVLDFVSPLDAPAATEPAGRPAKKRA